MARALVSFIDSASGHSDGTYTLYMTIIFCGSGVTGEQDLSSISVNINGNDSSSTIRTKISDAIVTEANRIGYTVTASEISMPYLDKGV